MWLLSFRKFLLKFQVYCYGQILRGDFFVHRNFIIWEGPDELFRFFERRNFQRKITLKWGEFQCGECFRIFPISVILQKLAIFD